MPNFHCHFPRDEEEKMPDENEVVDLGEQVPAPNENGEEEMDEDDIISVDDEEGGEEEVDDLVDDEIHDIDDTSSEASSIANDETVRRFVPVVSSSDENESEGGGFRTPPSTMRDDFEQLEVSSTVGQGYQPPHRNMARRSRARRPGVFYVRRGRHRQPLAEQEWQRLSPFERGLTFNGFARNLEPEKVIDHMFEHPHEILYRVKWRNMPESKFIESSVMRAYRPEMVVDYLESIIGRN